MRGKEKCKALKEIRKQIAENNDIEYAVSECTHQGDCKGTCPKCEAELRYLERELARKAKLGKTAVVAGLSALATIGLAGCNSKDKEDSPWGTTENTIEELGGVAVPEDLDGYVEIAGEETVEPTEEIIVDGEEDYPPDYTETSTQEGVLEK